MTDRINPGPGWRLLKLRETKRQGDEYLDGKRWLATKLPGTRIREDSLPVRRRVALATTKAIVTRATVRAAFRDGAVTDDVMTCDSGLSGPMMDFAIKRWEVVQRAAKVQGAKYIMLEIQREGEP